MNKNLSRREFLKTTALGTVGILTVTGWTSCMGEAKTGDDNFHQRLGFIGLGQQAMYLLNGFISMPGVEVIAGCDVYGVKRDRFLDRVTNFYKNKEREDENFQSPNLTLYSDYRELLNRKDIDAVIIAVPDHSHAFIAIDACKKKKNVYLEKPLTFTVKEGQELVKAVRGNNVILGVGSQQRSSDEFLHAVKLVRDGKLGKIEKVIAHVGEPPTPYNLPQEEIPEGLDWNAWLGSSYYRVHYNNRLNPQISLNPEKNETFWAAWRYHTELGGGFTTDWGAHMFDIVQWALEKDQSGPQKVKPLRIDGRDYIHYHYFDGPQIPEGGTLVTTEEYDGGRKGCQFIGEKGWIWVERGSENFRASNPEWMPGASEDAGDVPYETKVSHLGDFIEACRSKTDPVVPVEIGHRTCTVCNIGNIAIELGRELTWDPQKEKFIGDNEANEKLTRPYAPGYSI